MIKKVLTLKYIRSFLIFAVLAGVGYYAVNRPWWWYDIKTLRPLNRTSAILIRGSDFPWERYWVIKQDVDRGMLWYQKIPAPRLGTNSLSLGHDTVSVQFWNSSRRIEGKAKNYQDSDKFKLMGTYDLKDGRELWSYNPTVRKRWSTLFKNLSGEHVLYAFTYDHKKNVFGTEVTAFHRRSGKLLWEKELKSVTGASLRDDILHTQGYWTHSFYNQAGQFLHRYVSMDCYSGADFWYVSEQDGDLRKVQFKPFRDKVSIRGWKPPGNETSILACGEYKGRLIILHFSRLSGKPHRALSISEISPITGKQLRTISLDSGKKVSRFHLLRHYSNARKNPMNGPYDRYILLRSYPVGSNLKPTFYTFDLKTFQLVDTTNSSESILPGQFMKHGNRYYIYGSPFLAVWNGATGRLEKAVSMHYFDMYQLSNSQIKDGSLWLKGYSGKFAVLDAKSLELLHRGGFNVKVKDVTEEIKKLTGLK